MDRSYLSDKAVVEASREFVCVRLISFENTEEHELMQRLWGGGSVNTVFTILDPTGKRRLSGVARSPKRPFGTAAALTSKMKQIAARYPSKKRASSKQALPVLEDVRIGLNVAACDAQQLVILRGDAKQIADLEQRVAKLAWSDAFLGRFLYARGDQQTDWSVLDGLDAAPADGLLVVTPAKFGLQGKVTATLPADATEKQLAVVLEAAVAAFKPAAVNTRRLIREGRRKRISWQPEVAKQRKR